MKTFALAFFFCFITSFALEIHPNIPAVEYAVRGPILRRAQELKKQLATGTADLPFDELLFCT